MQAIARRCLVVAADTALRAVLASGADPDFVLVVDPQYWNARHLDRCPAPASVLISESAVYPSVLRTAGSRARSPAGERAYLRSFLCASLFPLGRFVEDRVDPKGELGAGGSVATTAWDFVRTLGAGPIWTAGLDLGFPELKTHFKGALFEERAHADCDRTDPGELRSFKALRDGRPFKAPGVDGGEVLTDKRLSLYGAWFEARFARYPEAAPKSLSRGGLRIAGMKTCDISEILALPDRRKEIDERLGAAYAEVDAAFMAPAAAERRRVLFSEVDRELTESLRSLVEIAETGAKAARNAYLMGDTNRAFLELEKTNESIQSSPAKDVAGFLFPPISELEAELRTDPSDPAGRHIELSERIYGSLASAASFHLGLLEKRKNK